MSDIPPPTRRARKTTEGESLPLAPAVAQAAASSEREADDPHRLPTAQLEMAAFGDHLIPYVPPVPPTPASLAPWALVLGIVSLVGALFTGWLLPLGACAVVVAIISLRRRDDSRRIAGWALALALLAAAFSIGWLIWGFSQLAVR